MSQLAIPLINLQKEFRLLKNKMISKLTKVMEAGEFIGGKELEIFEKSFAKYLGVKEVIGVASGTAALFLSIKALELGTGDEVITNAMSFNATPEAIMYTGATPVFVDIQKNDGGINCKLIEKSITKRTKAILVVHLYGVPADMDALQKLCKKHRLFLIEDCAQAHGATYKGKKVGTYGSLGCFSFMAAKNIGAYGDAGCITTNDLRLATIIRKLKDHGRASKYIHDMLGYAERMDNIQAAVLNIKLPYLDKWNDRRNAIAKIYKKELSDYVQCLDVSNHKTCSYYVFPLLTKERDALQKYLQDNDIGTNIYYPIPLHQQPVYAKTYNMTPSVPIAEYRAKNTIAIPMHPFLTTKEIKYIIKTIKRFFEKKETGLYADEYLQKQYKNTDNLQTRLKIREKRGMNAHTLHDCIVDYIRSYLDIQKKNKVLDIGCGTGIFLKKIQEQKTMNRKITMFAVDKAPAMVQSAQKIIDAKNVVVADIGDLPYKDNTFDVVTALHVLHHVSDKESAMLEMQRVTKKGGICIVTVSQMAHNEGLNKLHYAALKKCKFPDEMQDYTKHGIDANQRIQNILKTRNFQGKKIQYKNNIQCSNIEDIVRYYRSGMMTRGSDGLDISPRKREELEKHIKQKIQDQIKKEGHYTIPGTIDIFIWEKK